MPDTDLLLYDIKAADPEIHKAYTGADNTQILENLASLLKAKTAVWVRIPVISGVNDTEDEFDRIRRFFDKNGYPEKTELLPYHALGEHKYAALGNAAESFSAPTKERLEILQKIVTCRKDR